MARGFSQRAIQFARNLLITALVCGLFWGGFGAMIRKGEFEGLAVALVVGVMVAFLFLLIGKVTKGGSDYPQDEDTYREHDYYYYFRDDHHDRK